MSRLAVVSLVLLWSGCQCARLPDLDWPCNEHADCDVDEQCVAARCRVVSDAGSPDGGPADAGRDAGSLLDAGDDAGVPDAGLDDAGSADAGVPDAGGPDAGAVDSGVDAGALDAGVVDPSCFDGGAQGREGNCTDGVDNDQDGFIDCADCDCPTNTPCRGSGVCDPFEVCTAGVCPPDQKAAPGSMCTDGNLCTSQDACDDAGACIGQVNSDLLLRCTLTSSDVLGQGVDCAGVSNACGEAAFMVTLARALPIDAVPQLSVTVWSTSATGCTGDWFLSQDPDGGAGYGPVNTAPYRVSPTEFDGGVPLYQYRNTGSGVPKHIFGTNPQPPIGHVSEPSAPLFYACPP